MYDIESHLSDTEVDDLVFVSDISYSKKHIEDTHKALLNENKYTEAATYLNSQEGITPYVADLFNLIANRTKALQEKLLTKQKIRVMYIENSEPVEDAENQHWISDEE